MKVELLETSDAKPLDIDSLEFHKFEKLPVVIEAAVLTERAIIRTREGTIIGEVDEILIRGVKQELYPCGKEIFDETYKRVSDDTPLGLRR